MGFEAKYTYSQNPLMAEYESPKLSSSLELPAPVAQRSRTVRLANGIEMYYREAGDPSNQTMLLLHGFPTSSNYFRNLITLLSSSVYNFYVVAPDLPGFGATVCPESYNYTFQKLAETIVLFLDAIDISNFALYCMGEYGTLVALKIIQYKMENIMGLVIQNGTVYNDSRLDSSLLDLYHTELDTPTHAHSRFLHEHSDQKIGHKSYVSSLKSSRQSSNTSLFSDSSEAQAHHPSLGMLGNRNGSRVSFSMSVDEYVVDGDNSVHIITTPSDFSADDEEETENEDDRSNSTPIKPPSLILTPTKYSRPLAPCIVKPLIEPSIEQIKSLYLPEKSPDSNIAFSFNRNATTRTIDPHAYLFDYYLLIRPGQVHIQQQLYADFLANRQGIPLSSPTSMWLRTTNTPILILWGTNDPLLSQTVTVENFKRDCRCCEVKILDNGGHYALEYYPDEIAETIFNFFMKNKVNKAWSMMAY